MAPHGNQSNVGTTEFVLAGLPNLNGTGVDPFSMFFLIYLLTLTGNVLIVGVVGADRRLQTPMYFFLGNLSCLEILITSVIIPKMLSNFLSRQHTISFAACITQFYFYFFLGASEFLLLAVMSVDRYLAICRPLRYPLLMNGAVCCRVAVACWMGGLLPVLGPTVAVYLLPFCKQGAVVQHFFCDSGPLLHLACTNTTKLEEADFVLAFLVIVSSFTITAASYGRIVLAVLRMPSAAGRQKAFSTCTAHLVVVTLFYGSAVFLYVRPSQSGSVDTNWSVTVITTFVTPLLNPFIYALRNKQVKDALKDMFRKVLAELLEHSLLGKNLRRQTSAVPQHRFCRRKLRGHQSATPREAGDGFASLTDACPSSRRRSDPQYRRTQKKRNAALRVHVSPRSVHADPASRRISGPILKTGRDPVFASSGENSGFRGSVLLDLGEETAVAHCVH
ncbi:olfactory receptor 6S1 [Acomys russatus]|uniref:olfactory receptor 6S1 n=1 Tax=Acomys russatus TaxID=60746 RepID=UPI0021E1C087|nr:olfactory receptor 6S1 [Acomys russatus]